MKKYIQLSIAAEGSYSGAEYYECRFITDEIWESIKEDVLDEDFCIYELDGKHSCCKCEFEVDEFTEEELMEPGDTSCDGDTLKDYLCEVMSEYGYEHPGDILWGIKRDIEKLEELYPYEDVTVKIRKENKDKLLNFVKELQ